MNLFDLPASRAARDTGMEKAAYSSQKSAEWLSQARKVAEHLAMKHGETTSDAVQMICPKPEGVHQNACGSIFKGKKWVCTGFTQTSKVSGHARIIRIWGLRSE